MNAASVWWQKRKADCVNTIFTFMALYTELHFVQQFKFNSYSTNVYSVSSVNRIKFYVGMNMLQQNLLMVIF